MFRYRDTSNEGHTASVAWRRAPSRRPKVPPEQRPHASPRRPGPFIGRQHSARLAKWRSGRCGHCCLQRNPDSEEPEPPLVESVIPHGRLLVTPVVDRAVSPLPARGRERPVPVGSRRLAGPPRCRPVTPRRPAEVTTLRVSVPRAAGPTGSAGTPGSTGSARVIGSAGSAGSARVIGPAGPAGSTGTALRAAGVTGATRATRAAGTARTAGTTRTAGAARITRCVRWMDTSGCRPAVTAGRAGRWRTRSGVGRTGTHAQRGSSQGTGDGDPPKYLLQFHSPSPVYRLVNSSESPLPDRP